MHTQSLFSSKAINYQYMIFHHQNMTFPTAVNFFLDQPSTYFTVLVLS